MGSIVSDLFGGSSNKSTSNQSSQSQSTSNSQSTSDNKAFNTLNTNLAPTIANGGAASDAINGALTGSNDTAFKNYLNSTGYNFQMDQGSRAISGNAATKGLLNSGATAKALTTFGQNTAATGFNNYLGQLNQQVTAGNQAGSVLSGSGGESQSTSDAQSTATSTGQTTASGKSNNGILSSLF